MGIFELYIREKQLYIHTGTNRRPRGLPISAQCASAVKLPLIMNCEGKFTMTSQIIVRSTYIPLKQRDRIRIENRMLLASLAAIIIFMTSMGGVKKGTNPDQI